MPARQANFEKQLRDAIRARMLEEISAKQRGAAVNQNFYNGGAHGASSGEGASPGGVFAQLGGAPVSSSPSPEDLNDYWVDIAREDLGRGDAWDPNDPNKGAVRGEKAWTKKVHRYVTPKDGGEAKKKSRRAAR